MYRLLEKAYFEALKEGIEKGFYPAILAADEYVAEWFEDILRSDHDRHFVSAGDVAGNMGGIGQEY